MSTTTRTPTATQAGAVPQALGLEARLASVEAALTLRLETAALAVEVNTAHIPTDPVDLTDVVRGPLTPASAPRLLPDDLYPTPVAALLQRAAHRLETGGWCRGGTVAEDGARCLYGALRAEDPGGEHLDDALTVLLEALRREFGPDVETVPSANDHLVRGQAHAVRILGDAAALADTRGL